MCFFLHGRGWTRKFQNEYGPFNYSVSIVIFSLLTALLVLAGAEWSARKPLGVSKTLGSEKLRS